MPEEFNTVICEKCFYWYLEDVFHLYSGTTGTTGILTSNLDLYQTLPLGQAV